MRSSVRLTSTCGTSCGHRSARCCATTAFAFGCCHKKNYQHRSGLTIQRSENSQAMRDELTREAHLQTDRDCSWVRGSGGALAVCCRPPPVGPPYGDASAAWCHDSCCARANKGAFSEPQCWGMTENGRFYEAGSAERQCHMRAAQVRTIRKPPRTQQAQTGARTSSGTELLR